MDSCKESVSDGRGTQWMSLRGAESDHSRRIDDGYDNYDDSALNRGERGIADQDRPDGAHAFHPGAA